MKSRRYALQTSKGELKIELPPQCSEKDLEQMKSFMNWAYRQAGGKPPKKTLAEKIGLVSKSDMIDGSYYKQ